MGELAWLRLMGGAMCEVEYMLEGSAFEAMDFSSARAYKAVAAAWCDHHVLPLKVLEITS